MVMWNIQNVRMLQRKIMHTELQAQSYKYIELTTDEMMKNIKNLNGIKHEGNQMRYGGMWIMWSIT